ncbi:unnamed protein product [Linum trigynum]|uniref:Nuclear pore complex protein NUP1 n=1 Tax=Linum trigynum TaxID=586398 RepID=A0AAV2GZ77_9ROSI
MERSSEPRQPYPAGEEGRGAGGKLRKRTARRAATPYARPQQSLAQRTRPWLSKLANLVLPSYFSQSGNALPAPPAAERGVGDEEEEEEDHGESGNQVEENVGRDEISLSFNHLGSGSTELGGTNEVTNELNSRPEIERVEEQHTVNTSDLDGVSAIEQLLMNKKFSRDEVNRLIEIIHSRAANSPNKEEEKQHSGMFGRDAGPSAFLEDSQRCREAEKKHTSSITQGIFQPAAWAETSRKSTEVQHEDTNRTTWGGSTPLIQSTVEDEVGASPIQIAKAYMQKRTSGLGLEDAAVKDEGPSSRGDEMALQPFTPSSFIRPSPCWPGARVRDQNEYAAPLSQSGRFGLQSFPRTPYSRAIASKSKSKLIQLQGSSRRSLNMPSTPFQPPQSSTFGQFSSRERKLDIGEGSVGPIRRTRRQGAAVELSARGSPFVRPSVDTPKVENINVPEGIFSAWKKDSETGRKPHSEVSTPTIPSHSSQVARKILEHLDRNPVTPKQKSDELRLTTSWKKPESSSDITAFTPLKHNRLPQFGILDSSGNSYQADNKKKSLHWSEDRGKSLFKDPQETTNDVNGKSSAPGITIGSNAVDPGPSQVLKKNVDSEIVKANEVSGLQKKPPAHSSGTRPVLSSIAIGKREQKWASSDGNASFSFQVPASSTGVFSEPPTPSMPSSSANGLHQPEADEQSIPTYSFGSNKGPNSALVFSFPSTSSSSSSLPDGTSDLKFKFGSDKSSRVSFSSIGKDSVCY